MEIQTDTAIPDIASLHQKRANRTDRFWTNDDFGHLERVAPPEIAWATRLAALTGLRRGDLIHLRWSDVQENSIEFMTQKSKRLVVIPIHTDLRSLLDKIPKRAATVLTNNHSQPWTNYGFGYSWLKAIKTAGINLTFHDLRRTAAIKLVIANLEAGEIANIMEWSPRKLDRLVDRLSRAACESFLSQESNFG